MRSAASGLWGALPVGACLRVALGIAGEWAVPGEFWVFRRRFECSAAGSRGKEAARGRIWGAQAVIRVGAAGERSGRGSLLR